ncbi:hypothetical protein [Azospirillum sp. B506]|uniref:hypothetical protein n=1 Tax=Azospirillum sp. B506 TaxID=137721 RepID=UPI000348CA3A|nr:hypothetical protein [Azospirillum sp. B506]
MARYNFLRLTMVAVAAAVLHLGLFHADARAQASGSFNSRVSSGDVTSSAQGGGSASVRIGSAPNGQGGVNTTVHTKDVTATARGGSSTTTLGSRGGTVVIDGDVYNDGGTIAIEGESFVNGRVTVVPGSNLVMGNCGSVAVNGDVHIGGGNLEVGCGCAGWRDGACCIQFYDGLCVVNQVPPGKHGCPPEYHFRGGLCRLFKDFSMQYGK